MKLLDKTVVVDAAGRVIKPCHDYAEALDFMRPAPPAESDLAKLGAQDTKTECYDLKCDRSFLSFELMVEHAEAVHTFDDIERMVREVVREKYYKAGDYKANPVVPTVWAWVDDLATDWVVFRVETDGDSTLYKASYSIVDDTVTLGDPTEVVRRTVYDPVKKTNAED